MDSGVSEGGAFSARNWLVIGAAIAVASGAVALVIFGPFGKFALSSSSMAPTFAEGDVVSVGHSKLYCGHPPLKPGDVVAYRKPSKPGVTFMHRLVAGPGATVEEKAGRLFIDGAPVAARVEAVTKFRDQDAKIVRETLSDGASYRTLEFARPDGPFDTFGPVKVPPGSWFIMGDNRDDALDSRFDGPVPESQICFVVDKIVSSADPTHVGKRP